MKVFHLETDILVSDAQSPEHLNTNVMAPPQVGSVSPPADGLTCQDGLTLQDQAASEFVLDCDGATLNNSLKFSDRPPMSPGYKHFNDFFSQLPAQRMLTDPNSILDFNCSRFTDLWVSECGPLENLELESSTYPSVYDCYFRENLCQLPPRRRFAYRTITSRINNYVSIQCDSLESLKSLREIHLRLSVQLKIAKWISFACERVIKIPNVELIREGVYRVPRLAIQTSFLTKRRLWLRRGPLGNWGLKSLTCLLENECPSLVNLLSRSHLRVCRTPKGCSLEVRHDETINPSADGKLDLRLQCMQICEPAGSQSGPQALPDGEMIQVDSLQREEIVECVATNNGGNVGGEGLRLTAITLSKKNKRKMSERKCTPDKSIDLVDLQQHYGKTREDAANRLGVSISTLKRRCREYGISRWPSHKINKDKQSLSTSTRKGVTKSVLGAEGSRNPTSLSPKLLPGAVGTVSWSSSLNGSHRGYIQGSKEGRTWTVTSHDVCLGNSIKETPPAMDSFISPTHKECIEVGSFPELASEPTDSEPQRPLGGTLIENAGSSENLSNFFSLAAEADLEGRISESDCTDLPCSDPASKQAMATLSRPMPHVGAKQDTRFVTFKAEYGKHTKRKIRFKTSSTSGIDKLKEEVTKRLMLEANTFSIEYRDNENDWVLIACDEDLHDSMNISSSLGNNIIRLRVT
ncbi:hypothetical protein F0562_003141 [Nyssa sinensis]|uniref:PB1 domain-containing protein n=1 Tax=Nyssa sinensis TaxID=561372 RepID=A0A5J5BYL1_9ASTE|nr:hypothetical protein F0562_003141 [Nyssa sinensis]